MHQFVSASTQRTMNLKRVLHEALQADGATPLTRASIACRVQITRATASRLTDELVNGGLLTQISPPATGAPGRPGMHLEGNNALASLGVDVGVSGINLVALGLGGKELANRRIEVEVPSFSQDDFFARLGLELNTLVSWLGANTQIIAVTVAVPGLVDREKGTVIYAPNLGWSGTDVPQQLRKHLRFDVEDIRLENEANMAAWAVSWQRPAVAGELDSFAYISGGVGVGAAVVEDRQLVLGRHGWAGEVGHLTIDPAGAECRCGSRGCLERYVGREALSRAQDNPTQLKKAAQALGLALSSLTNLFDVSLLMIGGDLVELYRDQSSQVDEVLRRHTLAAEQRTLEVRLHHGVLSSARGAALFGFENLLATPQTYLNTIAS